MQLSVLNHRGRDPAQDFAEGPGNPGSGAHAPINFHAFAACSRGSFQVATDAALATGNPILVLIRRRLRGTLKVVRECKAQGRFVLVSWKETGLQQVEDQLRSASAWQHFREICSLADGCLSVTEELVPIYRAAAPTTPTAFLPTPYPVDHPEWNFARPSTECRGLFVGTRRFKHRARCHQLALSQVALLARETGCRVTVINPDGRQAEKRILAFGVPRAQLEVHAPLPYPDYLRLMASHRLVFQRDLGAVPGQVAGDALLCRIPCIGGNGAIDRIVNPGKCGGQVSGRELADIAQRLLTDTSYFEQEREALEGRGLDELAFAVVRQKLAEFVQDPSTPLNSHPVRRERVTGEDRRQIRGTEALHQDLA